MSNSSCGNFTLTRVLSDLQSSYTEKTYHSETYGWFVEMEDDSDEAVAAAGAGIDPYTASKHDLAFTAPTAPKAENYDAELQWATAADTVDDVLGDFF